MDNHTLLSSFGKWVSPINVEKLTEQITQTGQDRYTKKFTTYSYIKLLLLSHLEEVESLHAMSDTLFDDDIQQELGLNSISVSQWLLKAKLWKECRHWLRRISGIP
ncbi:DUF4372 domain-containing protein [Lentibacillus salicampi]|nr:DUF4372 domain-containing protein [Lentibacillus salicampi]